MVFHSPIRSTMDSQSSYHAASRAQSTAEQTRTEVEALETRVERLKLVTRALWEIVRDNTPITEAMLEAKVTEIDRRDGQVDGRTSPGVLACQQCKRTIQRGQDACQYCGHVQGFESVFDWIR